MSRLLRGSTRGDEVTVHPDGRREWGGPPEAVAGEQKAAETVIEEARNRAAEVLQRGAEEAAAARVRAVAEGLDQGYREGVGAARAELAAALALVQQIAQDGKALRDRLLAGCEREIVELVIGGVEAVLGAQVRANPELVTETVRRALDRAGAQNLVRIRVSPQDQALVAAWVSERSGDAPAWEVDSDGTIGVGGCVIDTEAGQVDARLDAQVAQIARTLRAAVPESPAADGDQASPAECAAEGDGR